jgi:hypothetical protein
MDDLGVTVTEWLGLEVEAAERIAQRAGVRLRSVHRHEYAGRVAPVAEFDVDGVLFSFIPGGEVDLGFDPSGWSPTDAELASFLGDEDALNPFVAGAVPTVPPGGDVSDMREHLAEHTTSPRRVVVAPLLVAVESREAGVRDVGLDHPVIAAILAEQPSRAEGIHIEDMFKPDDDTTTYGRVRYDETGRPVEAWLAEHTTYTTIVDQLSRSGQRLLTPDEWEHAAALGGQTLFAWGDRCPDRSDDDRLGTPDGRWFSWTQPKLAGLRIAENPYNVEVSLDPTQVRGGDGGGGIPRRGSLVSPVVAPRTGVHRQHARRVSPSPKQRASAMGPPGNRDQPVRPTNLLRSGGDHRRAKPTGPLHARRAPLRGHSVPLGDLIYGPVIRRVAGGVHICSDHVGNEPR